MRTLEIGVGFVLGVAAAVIVERHDEVAGMLADRRAVGTIFVNIVAVMEHKGEVLGSEVAVSGVIAGLVILAAGHREAQVARGRADRG